MTLWKKAVALLLAAAMMVPLALAAPSTEGSFSDVEDHWAQAEIEKAVATGWVDGYPDGTFKPEKTITRAEFTKMILDAIHLTYPDGSFQPNKASTRAEAVVMVQRMLDVMEEGLDPDIHLVVQYQDKNGTTVVRDRPSLTMQVVDGMVYIPVRGLFELQADMMKEAGSEYAGYWGQFWYALWWPVEQICCVENTLGNEPLVFNYQMGTDHYFNDNLLLGVARSLYGEVMIPVCDLNHPDSEVQDNWYQDNWHGAWDGESNTLTLSLRYHAPTLV